MTKQGHSNAMSVLSTTDVKSFYKSMSDLEMLATHFIKRSYLEDLTKLPRMQEIPKQAFLMDCKSPLFISYLWRDTNRPNDNMLNDLRSLVPNNEKIGLWIDYCCLPQKRSDGEDDRTEEEILFFKSQLQYIPTILLKSQTIVLWDIKNIDRAWCFVELVLADIFKNVIMKQIYNCKNKLSEAMMYVTQTYDPMEYCVTGGVIGTPVAKILCPNNIKNIPNIFYNHLLNQLGMSPTPLTTLLGYVKRLHIDNYFEEYQLKCTNIHDIRVLKDLLLRVCEFAGSYDVTSIKWTGKIHYTQLIPYIMANTSDFTVDLVDYKF